MSVRRLREATQASPRFQTVEPKSAMSDGEHEYLRQHVDPVLMPLIEALLLYQPDSIYEFICDYVDERQSPRFRFSVSASKLTTRRSMVEFMSTSVIPVMDDLARQILRERPSSVKHFIHDVVAARIVLGRSESNQSEASYYKLHDTVLCRYKGRPRYFRGVITAVEVVDSADALFTIQFDDGKVETRVHAVCLKPWSAATDATDVSSRPSTASNQEQHHELEASKAIVPAKVVQMDIVVLIIGIDGAGKTTLLSTLQGDLDKEHVPSAGFTSASFELDTGAVTFYDLGGGPTFRDVWKEYYADVHGVIFVVDSSRENAVQEAAGVMSDAMAHERMAGKPLLVFANKRDQPSALAEKTVGEHLRLDRFSTVKCVPCVAKPAANGSLVDERLEAGLSWLFDQVKVQFPVLDERVKKDLASKKLADQQRRDEQRARVSRWKEERERQQMLLHDSDRHQRAAADNQAAAAAAAGETKRVATPESDSSVILCSNCSTEPAVTKCAASKWMPVCSSCATTLKTSQ